MPSLSEHFQNKEPSAIRLASAEFAKRQDGARDINTAIGNVSLPMHPAMQERMHHWGNKGSLLEQGVVPYTPTVGAAETQDAFRHVIEASGFSAKDLYVQITDGGSQAMELAILGCCGPAGTEEKPLLVMDPAYTNYGEMAKRLGRKTVSVTRALKEDGTFTLPDMAEIEGAIEREKPGAFLVIPYDNPSGQFINREALKKLAELCARHDIWMISDEAYRELHYTGEPASSIWGVTDKDVPGIEGRRISIESASKVWNACGLRTGALITDNKEFHTRAVAEQTTNLCSNTLGQHIFAGLTSQSREELQAWFKRQRDYYKELMRRMAEGIRDLVQGAIVSQTQAAIYSVVDVRNIAAPGFSAKEFVLYCAQKGAVNIEGRPTTLLTAPMAGFYGTKPGQPNPGLTQMRIAHVCPPEEMALVPQLFAELLKQFEEGRR
ncbi:MAG: aminotransferase class I/II-fold pyridoxal phosphate-dependent enzyme [Candidatus Peregrinibacteria bacterium]